MAAALTAPGPPPRLHGTFLQLWAAHKDWPDSRWTELFGYLRDLGLREVVVQWSRYDAIDYRPEVERVLRAGFDVWMGLGYDSRWWQRPSPEMVCDAARDVSPIAGVRGYYLPQEVESGSWTDKRYVRALAEAIHSVRKMFRPLALSGFTNRGGSPVELARFWRTLQRKSKFDRLLFQDGIGSGKMPITEWPEWASPLARQLGRRLNIVVETFAAQGEGANWRAEPAEWPRIQEQLRLAAAASLNDILAFSVPEYMTPLGGEAALQLFRQVLLNRTDTPQ